MEDSLKKRYSIKLIANIISGIINIILVAIVPKALGTVAFGQFSYLQQFFSQLIAFLDAGTSTAFFSKLSARHERKELISFYFLFSLSLVLLLFSIVFFVDIAGFIDLFLPDIPPEYVYLGLWFGFFTWFTQICIKISDAYALTVSVELIKIGHKLITLCLLLYLVQQLAFSLSIYFFFHYFALVTFLIVLMILFIKKKIFTHQILTLRLAYKSLISEFVRFSSPLFVFNVIGISVGVFDIWLLQKMSGSVETGFYGLAYSIAAMCFLFTSAMTPIITREFSKSYARSDMNGIRRLFKKYIPMLYAVSAYFGVFIAFESENILQIFTDETFRDAYIVLVVMALYPIHQTYGQLSGSLFFATENTLQYRNIGIVASLIGLVLTIIFVYFLELGALGFACKMILAQVISVNIQLYFNAKFLKLKLAPFIKHQIYAVTFFVVLAYVSTHFIPLFGNTIGDLLVAGLSYSLLVFVGLLLIPSLFMVDRNKLLTHFINRS
jgi:O-antigen/teichoic acid export membrane protein